MPDEILVTEKSALDNAIARAGFPLVMKIQSREIPHKSEVGGVRVNIATKGEVFLAYEALLESARRHRPDAEIQGVLVGPMAKKGVEIIVGTMEDATFGPMIMVGLGGITTELFRDVVYRPAPVSATEAAAMLAELKAAPLLNGFRNAAKADIASLSQLISQISAARCAVPRNRFPKSRSTRCWCIRRGRASPSSMRWWCRRLANVSTRRPRARGTHNR